MNPGDRKLSTAPADTLPMNLPVAAGILPAVEGRHLATRKKPRHDQGFWKFRDLVDWQRPIPPGWKRRLYGRWW